jgi:NTP pyrophosphatase (non-canonical NTP hydrolase)
MNQPHSDATKGLVALQAYYKTVATDRNWEDETPKDVLVLMTEEMGELARAIRKHEGIGRDGAYDDVPIADELADIQLYLLHLSNILGIELADAVSAKIEKNNQKPRQE